MRTVKHNVEKYEEDMPTNKLPRTVQDAIKTSHSLGINFLWVESM